MDKKDFVLPKLRTDLNYEIVEEENGQFIVLYDPFGYANQPVAIPLEALSLLQLLDGKLTKSQLQKALYDELDGESNAVFEPFLRLITYLDLLGYLESPRFYLIKEDIDSYINSPVRYPVCSGSSYPADPDELRQELDLILSSAKTMKVKSGAKAIIVPHIDFRIGRGAHKAYAAGYKALKDTEPDVFVIIGTSHYANSDMFMLTRKDYSTPLGIAKTDMELIDKLENELGADFTIDDMAHKTEHSIELQVVLIQYVFSGREFTILPVLAGSFHKFVEEKSLPSSEQRFSEFIDNLDKVIRSAGKNPVYIASADMAHIGRKFGDKFDAEPVLPELKEKDKELLDDLAACDADDFFNRVSDENDKWKICGLSPVYSMLKIVNPGKGEFLQYYQWNEKETKSAVSFASIAYY